jgi:hypothetical protein
MFPALLARAWWRGLDARPLAFGLSPPFPPFPHLPAPHSFSTAAAAASASTSSTLEHLPLKKVAVTRVGNPPQKGSKGPLRTPRRGVAATIYTCPPDVLRRALPERALQVAAALHARGHDVYLVGGSVRDLLRGQRYAGTVA